MHAKTIENLVEISLPKKKENSERYWLSKNLTAHFKQTLFGEFSFITRQFEQN